PAHAAARAEHQHGGPGRELALVDEVVGGGPGDRQGRGVGEGNLVRLEHGPGGVQHRVLRERTEPAGRCAEHRVPDGEALGPLADGGDDPRGLEPHRQRQTATGPERALPPLPVGGVHAGGADLDPDLPGARGRDLALGELLALGAAVGGDDEDCGHGDSSDDGVGGAGCGAAPTATPITRPRAAFVAASSTAGTGPRGGRPRCPRRCPCNDATGWWARPLRRGVTRCFSCAPETIRTSDTRFRRAVLYPLSYGGDPARPRAIAGPRASNILTLRGRISACPAVCTRPPPPSPRSSWPAVPPHGWPAPTRPACPSPARARWSASSPPLPAAVPSSRLRGPDEARLPLAGASALERVLRAAPVVRRIVVGPSGEDGDVLAERHGARFVLEDPPRSGPLAALARGVAEFSEGTDEAIVLVLGGDMPMLRPETLAALAASSSRSGAVTALEAEDGHLQFLGAAWPLGRLREALAAIEHPGGGWADLSLRRLYAQLAEEELATLPATGAEGADIDTPDALAQVRRVA